MCQDFYTLGKYKNELPSNSCPLCPSNWAIPYPNRAYSAPKPCPKIFVEPGGQLPALHCAGCGQTWPFVALCDPLWRFFFKVLPLRSLHEEAGAERGSNPREDRTHVYVFLRRKSTSGFFILLRSIKNKVQFWASILRRLATLAACWGGPHPNFDQAEHEHI